MSFWFNPLTFRCTKNMSLHLHEDPLKPDKVYVKGLDWHLYMLAEYFETSCKGKHLKKEGVVEFPVESKPLLNIKELNLRIQKEELKARLPLGARKKRRPENKTLIGSQLPSNSGPPSFRKFA